MKDLGALRGLVGELYMLLSATHAVPELQKDSALMELLETKLTGLFEEMVWSGRLPVTPAVDGRVD